MNKDYATEYNVRSLKKIADELHELNKNISELTKAVQKNKPYVAPVIPNVDHEDFPTDPNDWPPGPSITCDDPRDNCEYTVKANPYCGPASDYIDQSIIAHKISFVDGSVANVVTDTTSDWQEAE